MKNLKISDYIAPRIDPLLHPGKRPPDSYVMDGDNNIFLIRDIEKGIKTAYIETLEGQVRVNDFLKHYQIASLEERIPVIAYGTNPCPGQLKYKFCSIDNSIVPVIKGHIDGWDTIYKFIYDAGYAYAQLIPAENVRVEAWITLLDQAQYEHMNLTEGVFNKEQDYRVGIMSDFQIKEAGGLEALLYVGNTKILLSPEYKGYKNTVISIAEIPAKGRENPILTQEEMLNHGLDIFHLYEFLKAYEDEMGTFQGSPGRKLAYYLNKHFNLHHGGAFKCNRCAALISHIHELTESQNCQDMAISEMLETKKNLTIEPNRSPFRFGDVWS